jgi:hypothetical protein
MRHQDDYALRTEKAEGEVIRPIENTFLAFGYSKVTRFFTCNPGKALAYHADDAY